MMTYAQIPQCFPIQHLLKISPSFSSRYQKITNKHHQQIQRNYQLLDEVTEVHLRITSYVPVRTKQPAAAASATLWPAKPSTREPPTNAIGTIA